MSISRQMAQLLAQLHPDHYPSVLLSCKSGAPHDLLPEIDFENTESVVFVEAFIARRNAQDGGDVLLEIVKR